jgi:hypothetical protein
MQPQLFYKAITRKLISGKLPSGECEFVLIDHVFKYSNGSEVATKLKMRFRV